MPHRVVGYLGTSEEVLTLYRSLDYTPEYASEVYGAIVIRYAFPIYMQGQLLQLPSNPSQTLPLKNVCKAASKVQNFEAIS
jgi:hypothetical protein